METYEALLFLMKTGKDEFHDKAYLFYKNGEKQGRNLTFKLKEGENPILKIVHNAREVVMLPTGTRILGAPYRITSEYGSGKNKRTIDVVTAMIFDNGYGNEPIALPRSGFEKCIGSSIEEYKKKVAGGRERSQLQKYIDEFYSSLKSLQTRRTI